MLSREEDKNGRQGQNITIHFDNIDLNNIIDVFNRIDLNKVIAVLQTINETSNRSSKKEQYVEIAEQKELSKNVGNAETHEDTGQEKVKDTEDGVLKEGTDSNEVPEDQNIKDIMQGENSDTLKDNKEEALEVRMPQDSMPENESEGNPEEKNGEGDQRVTINDETGLVSRKNDSEKEVENASESKVKAADTDTEKVQKKTSDMLTGSKNKGISNTIDNPIPSGQQTVGNTNKTSLPTAGGDTSMSTPQVLQGDNTSKPITPQSQIGSAQRPEGTTERSNTTPKSNLAPQGVSNTGGINNSGSNQGGKPSSSQIRPDPVSSTNKTSGNSMSKTSLPTPGESMNRSAPAAQQGNNTTKPLTSQSQTGSAQKPQAAAGQTAAAPKSNPAPQGGNTGNISTNTSNKPSTTTSNTSSKPPTGGSSSKPTTPPANTASSANKVQGNVPLQEPAKAVRRQAVAGGIVPTGPDRGEELMKAIKPLLNYDNTQILNRIMQIYSIAKIIQRR